MRTNCLFFLFRSLSLGFGSSAGEHTARFRIHQDQYAATIFGSREKEFGKPQNIQQCKSQRNRPSRNEHSAATGTIASNAWRGE